MSTGYDKAKTVKLVSAIILLLFIAASVCLQFFTDTNRWIARLLLCVGVSGLIGQMTNKIAIRMIFDYVRIPHTKFNIPGSGLLQRNLDKVIDFISEGSIHILNPETIKNEIREQEVVGKLGDIFINESGQEPGLDRLIDIILDHVEKWMDNEDFYFLIRDGVIKDYAEKHIAIQIANATGIIDYDNLTYKIIDEIKKKIADTRQSPEDLDELKYVVRNLLQDTTYSKDDIEEQLLALVGVVLKKFDFATVVKNRLQAFTPEQIKAAILEGASEYLGWIEVWGGILGGLVGILMWSVL
ncbi:MAG: DUF445 family protein [Planctomycetes bacterium]|nr:DUF445 family protein [Planctomycetota bacterium]